MKKLLLAVTSLSLFTSASVYANVDKAEKKSDYYIKANIGAGIFKPGKSRLYDDTGAMKLITGKNEIKNHR